MRAAAGAEAGDDVSLEITPAAEEPEPKVPADLRKALVAAHPKARTVWSDITPVGRRDWIQWIEKDENGAITGFIFTTGTGLGTGNRPASVQRAVRKGAAPGAQ